MKAIILVGGLGTRLRPLTIGTPKPLLPILNIPFVAYQLDQLKAAGIREVRLAAGAHARAWLRDLTALVPRGMSVKLAVERSPLGTGGAIRHAFEGFNRLDRSDVVVLNGDVFIDLDVRKMAAAHRRARAEATIAMRRVADAAAFGRLDVGPGNRIRAFREKTGERTPGRINAGAYVLSDRLVRSIPHRPCSVERDVFPQAIKAANAVFGFPVSGYWNDIGTPGSYRAAHWDLFPDRGWTGAGILRKRVAAGWGTGRSRLLRKKGGRAWAAPGLRIHPTAKIAGRNCFGDNVRIGAGAVIEDSILLAGCQIGASVRLVDVIVGPGAVIGDFAVLGPGCVLGPGTVISSFSKFS